MKNEKNLAYSLITVKSIDEDKREITGIATTPTPDRDGDIVVPEGAKFVTPLPLLWQHRHDQPVGHVTSAKVTKNGIEFKAVFAAEGLLARIDEAWKLVKAQLVRGVSIGFRALEYSRMETGGIKFLEWEWFELSLVTIPANAEASIRTLKSVDRPYLDAGTLPGASGNVSNRNLERPKMKTIKEQIEAFEAKRAALAKRQEAIMTKSAESGSTLDETEATEYDNIRAELKAIDEHLVRLREMDVVNVKSAQPVSATSQQQGSDNRVFVPGVVTLKSQLPKGTGFTRYAMALASAHGNRYEALQIAKKWQDSSPEVALVLKAAVDAGTTTDPTWASTLVDYTTLANEFIELLRPMTIVGRLNLRRVPFNVRMPSQTAGGTYGWVGEGAAKPVGELAFSELTLRWAKAAGIIVVSEELLRVSNPSAEAIVRQDMLAGIAAFLDVQFISPEIAEVANVSPASVTYGVTPVHASGTDADAVRADVKALWTNFLTNNIVPSTGVWVMSNIVAMSLSLMRNPLGQREFPDITPLGGTFEGYPVITSEAINADSNGGFMVFINQSDVLLADDGGVTIDVSREASLQMNTTPDNPTTAATVMVSLWQRNLVGIRAERMINWKKRRAAAVGFIDRIAYGA